MKVTKLDMIVISLLVMFVAMGGCWIALTWKF